jgi:hypothetical protein
LAWHGLTFRKPSSREEPPTHWKERSKANMTKFDSQMSTVRGSR